MRVRLIFAPIAIAALLSGCTPEDDAGESPPDGGNTLDAGLATDAAYAFDASWLDASWPDASWSDSATVDSSSSDAASDGETLDGGALADGGSDASLDAAADATASDGSAADGALDGSSVDGGGDASSDGAVSLDGSAADAAADAALDAGSCSDCCADGFARGVKGSGARLVRAFTPSPEGVTVCPNGDVFVALDGNGEIWRLPLSGAAAERWASVGARRPAGISCDAQGRLFVAIFSVTGGTTAPSVALIAGKDQAPVMLPAPSGAAALTGLNGVLAVAGLGVYASDTTTDRLVRWVESAPGTFVGSVVATNATGANGLALDPKTRKMYVAGSLNQRVYAYPVASDGSLGSRANAFTGNELAGFFDGVAVDASGTLYVASHVAGKVVRSPDNALVASVANPASLAFRGGTLFVTDYKVLSGSAAGGLYAIDLGVCGPTP